MTSTTECFVFTFPNPSFYIYFLIFLVFKFVWRRHFEFIFLYAQNVVSTSITLERRRVDVKMTLYAYFDWSELKLTHEYQSFHCFGKDCTRFFACEFLQNAILWAIDIPRGMLLRDQFFHIEGGRLLAMLSLVATVTSWFATTIALMWCVAQGTQSSVWYRKV